jgi:hypothetical protein
VDIKSFVGLEVKDADQGIVTAVFSTFGVVDKDNDIVEPGAIKDGTPIRVSAYGHASWNSYFANAELPTGKGIVHADDGKAWADMQFFLDTDHGKNTFLTVKNMGNLQEWSYSLQNVRAEYEDMEGVGQVRRIKSMDIHEVSPVLMGASIGTCTTMVKSGLKFQEHIDSVLAEVVKLTERTEQVMALRAQKGKQIAEVSADQLEELAEQLKALQSLLKSDPEEGIPLADEAMREYLRFQKTLVRV